MVRELIGRQTIRLDNIQALRGIAALLVVAQHATATYGNIKTDRPYVWLNGASGVDIFFVISGLVMILSSQRLINQVDGWKTFILRRIERIVPLYWIFTTIKLVALLAFPYLAKNGMPPIWHAVSPYLFIFSFSENGNAEPLPILTPGWSLNFEMLFYILFTLALWLRKPVLYIVVPIFVSLTTLYFLMPPFSENLASSEVWPAVFAIASPIVFEFVFGIIIGMSLLNGFSLDVRIAVILAPISFALLMIIPFGETIFDLHRVIVWGIPAAILVLCAASLEDSLTSWRPSLLLLIGDASYSLYLVHTVLLPVIVLMVQRLKIYYTPLGSEFVFLTICYIVLVTAGIYNYKFVEQPIITWFKNRRSISPAN